MPSATPLVVAKHRAVSDADRVSGFRRRRSVKEKVFARVLSGIQVRSGSSQSLLAASERCVCILYKVTQLLIHKIVLNSSTNYQCKGQRMLRFWRSSQSLSCDIHELR